MIIITISKIIIFLLAINLVALLVMFWDKKKSERKGERVSEKTLFSLALFFGGIGIYLGMWLFRHKTRKWYFLVGVPIAILINVYLLSLLLTRM